MLASLVRLVKSPEPAQTLQMNSVWVSIVSRAMRPTTDGDHQIATARQVVKFDTGGVMHFHHSVDWRPFLPQSRDRRDATISLFDGGRLLEKIDVNGDQWNRIDLFGLEPFLMEAVSSRTFCFALSRALNRR